MSASEAFRIQSNNYLANQKMSNQQIWKPLIIFAESSILDLWVGYEYAPMNFLTTY